MALSLACRAPTGSTRKLTCRPPFLPIKKARPPLGFFCGRAKRFNRERQERAKRFGGTFIHANDAKRFSRVKRFVLIIRRHHSEALPAEPLVSAEALPFEPQEGSASFGEMGAPRPDLGRGSASARRIFFRSIPMAQKGKRFPPLGPGNEALSSERRQRSASAPSGFFLGPGRDG